MARAAKRTAKGKAAAGLSATTIALIVLWVVTAIGVVIAYLIAAAGPM